MVDVFEWKSGSWVKHSRWTFGVFGSWHLFHLAERRATMGTFRGGEGRQDTGRRLYAGVSIELVVASVAT